MGTKRKIYLPSISGIAPSSAVGTEGLFQLLANYRYHAIGIEYAEGATFVTGSDVTAITAMLGDVIFRVNGKAQRTHTAAELDHQNSLNGSIYGYQTIGATNATKKQQLFINFAEPWRKDKTDTDMTAVTLNAANGVNDAQLSVKLATALTATGSIRAFAIVDDPMAPPSGGKQLLKRVYRQQIPASGTAIDITSTLDKRDAYQVISLKHPSTGYITKATLKLNGNTVHELERETNVALLVNHGMNPSNSVATGAFGYDLVLDDDDPVDSALPVVGQDLLLHLDFSAAAAGNVVAIIERVGLGWD